jgi:hypothetical protein
MGILPIMETYLVVLSGWNIRRHTIYSFKLTAY